MACNSRKRLLDSMSQESVKRCKFDGDVMDLQYDGNTEELQEDKKEVETNPSVSQYIPNVSCAGYIQRMQGIHFVSSNRVASTVPQFGACEQMWLAAQNGNQNQQPFAIGNNADIQKKLATGLSEVCQVA